MNDNASTVKIQTGKPRLSLLPVSALLGVAAVLQKSLDDGKYAIDSCRLGCSWRNIIDALLRHVLAFQEGQYTDPDSGLPTIDHVLANAMFLSDWQKRNKGIDDRFKVEDTRT